MRKLGLAFLAFFGLWLAAASAEAATCTWSGGTGAWNSSNTASWSCGHVPTTSDAVVFDGTSGGGTVTVDSPNGAGVVTVQSITCGAFTGTLDFSANNNDVTLGANGTAMNCSGSGTRTLNMGNGTWTISGNSATFTIATTTNLTFNANGSTLAFTGVNQKTFAGGGLTYNNVTFASSGEYYQITGNFSAATWTVTGPLMLKWTSGVTATITACPTFNSTSFSTVIGHDPTATSTATISVGAGAGTCTLQWQSLHRMTFAGGATWVANNSFNIGGNTGITINGPSGSGIIGGG